LSLFGAPHLVNNIIRGMYQTECTADVCYL